MALFQHEDDDGDALEVSGTEETEYDPRYHLLFTATRSSGRASSCALDMEALKRLHSLLGEWLYPHHRAEEPNLTLIEKMVAKAVKEQVSAVLPLHLSPVTIVGEPDRPHRLQFCELEDCSLFRGTHFHEAHFEHDPEPVICKRCGARPEGDHRDCGGVDRRCVYIGPDHDDYDVALKASIQAKATGPADPEPQEVGHPVKPHFPPVHLTTEADCKADHCIAARHLGSVHPSPVAYVPEPDAEDGWTSHECDPEPHDGLWRKPGDIDDVPSPVSKPRLMADLPRREPKLAATWDDRLFQGVTPFCDECDHVWSRHSVALGKCSVRVNGVHCGCNVLERRHS